jgi:peptidoglycan/LPS O-acetylase OafA/YrhL
MRKSFGAIFAGLIVMATLHAATNWAMRATGVFPAAGRPMSGGLWLLAAFYRALESIAAGWATARRAPNRPLRHALVLGAVATVLTILLTTATDDKDRDFGPGWYALSLVVVTLPCAYLGGRLQGKAKARRTAPRTIHLW